MKRYDFKNPEDFKELERMAYDGTIDISKFPPAAYRYFDRLRILYAEFRFNNLSKSEAVRRKTELYAEYRNALSAYEHWCEAHKAYQGNIRKADVLMSDIEKSQDVKEIALIACQIIGILTGDEEFAKRQKKNIKAATELVLC